jgi:hypothetical protein
VNNVVYCRPDKGDELVGCGAPGTRVRELDSLSKATASKSLHGAICGRCDSLNTLDIKTPTPSKTPKRMPQATADPRAERGPPGGKCENNS